MDLKDEQWAVVEPLLPKRPGRTDVKGRPRVDDRVIPNGILWVLHIASPWHDIPNRYPPYLKCHRHFREWVEKGVFQDLKTITTRKV
jgi:putative transposase